MARRFEHPYLPSTQDAAIRRARDGAPDGTWVVALRQGHGRGRSSHSWESPEGGLYLSRIVREPAHEPSLLPVAVGARLAGELSREFGVFCQVKWPNDIVVPDSHRATRKLAGILVDRVGSTTGALLVVGVGVNVSTPSSLYPSELRPRIAVLSELVGRTLRPLDLEPTVLRAIRGVAEDLSTLAGAARVAADCRAALYGVGRPALVDGAAAGVIRELGDDGTLWLDRDGERVAVRAGDLTVLEEEA